MATTEGPSRPHDRHGRRRPFASWMKRLANLKNPSSSTSDAPNSSDSKHRNHVSASKSKKSARNNPYPLSGNVYSPDVRYANRHLSFSEPATSVRRSQVSYSDSYVEENEQNPPTTGRKSAAPTLSTNADTTISDSKAGTLATVAGGHGGGEGSTFSSPSPSVRSLTTTLTTVQSAAPMNQIYHPQNTGGSNQAATNNTGASNQQVQFTHQFPTTPASAIPAHVAQNPTTYSSATANNLLTDNASILTLASSSKRRRRNSLDTNASVRALAPSSLFSGSRESLPLSVLSGTAPVGNEREPSSASIMNSGGVLSRTGIGGIERASSYSSGAPALADRGSIRSGLQSHHTRNNSATGSLTSGPLATGGSTYAPTTQGRISRRSSGWGEVPDTEDETETPREEQLPEEPNEQEAKATEVSQNHAKGKETTS